MATWKVYIAPINNDGSWDEWQEVTPNVINRSIGSISQETEISDYDVGIAVTDSVNIQLDNTQGLFSPAGSTNSIFPLKRDLSKVKITYLFGDHAPICGVAIAGFDVLGPEEIVFEGFITEKDARQDVASDIITFTVLGKESYLDRVETDVDAITITGSTTMGGLISLILLESGNISDVFDHDILQWSLTIDPTLSEVLSTISIEFLRGTTVREAISRLLEAVASIMIFDGYNIIVKDRDPYAGIKYNFYGQASNLGIENIADITDYNSGINRTFNVWKWKDTSLIARDTTSIDQYGVIKHDDLDYELVSQDVYRQTLLSAYRDEFGSPKVEMVLSTPINLLTLQLNLLEKVAIDYPNVQINPIGGLAPVWGTSSMIWNEESEYVTGESYFVWPDGLFNIEISQNQEWKIIGLEIDIRSDILNLRLREV